MEGIVHYGAFVAAVTVMALTPGVDTTYVLNKAITQGRKAGVYATLGIGSGVLVHTTLAALGLSVILAESATAFSVVKYLGAAYLLYLGSRKLLSSDHSTPTSGALPPRPSQRQNFVSAVLTNVLNPKVALTFLAFFPQFVDSAYLKTPLPFLLLGATYGGITTLWYLLLSNFAALFSDRLLRNTTFSAWLNKLTGGVFLLLSLKVALSKR